MRTQTTVTGTPFAEQVLWHVYPLGAAGAPIREGQAPAPGFEYGTGLKRLTEWLAYAEALEVTGLLLAPIHTSESHGYDTLDHFTVDPRLGTEEDFDAFISAAHAHGLDVMLDGVFSHVGRNHPWLRADLEAGAADAGHRPDMFDVDWDAPGGPTPRVWEGHEILARFDHASQAARDHAVEVMCHWLERGISGWRLDAAYSVPADFWATVLPRVRERHPKAWILGEVIHGDYASIAASSGFDSVTQYELWKSTWSGIADRNLYELQWTLTRHNEQVERGLATGFVPQTFVGNHDVTRIASAAGAGGALAALAILMTVPGVPSIYYGDEQAFEAVKTDTLGGDDAVRPPLPATPADLAPFGAWMYDCHRGLIAARRARPWIATGRVEVTEISYYPRMVIRTTSRDDAARWIDTEIDLGAEPGTWPRIVVSDDAGQVIWGAPHRG